jgi:hypothetical protein
MKSHGIAGMLVSAATLVLAVSGHLALLLVVIPASVLFSYWTARENRSGQRRI